MGYKYLKEISEMALGCKNVLPVDFNPKKACNFDCVYCGVGRTTIWTVDRTAFYPVEEVFTEIREYLQENGEAQHIMLTGSGEPALYSGFGELARKIKDHFPNIKIMAYSNCSLLNRDDVRNEFSLCDILGCNLNSVYEEGFRKTCRAHKAVKLKDALEGLRKFREEYNGLLYVDTKFVKGLNDSEKNVDGLIEYLSALKPDRYVVVAVKYKDEKPTEEFCNLVKKKMNNLPFPVAFYP